MKRVSKVREDAYAAVFGALAHPARRRVLMAVHFGGGAMRAGSIAACFSHAWQTTTRHLQVLEAAGLLRHERQGRQRIYRIERKRLELVRDWLGLVSRMPEGRPRRNERCRPGRSPRAGNRGRETSRNSSD